MDGSDPVGGEETKLAQEVIRPRLHSTRRVNEEINSFSPRDLNVRRCSHLDHIATNKIEAADYVLVFDIRHRDGNEKPSLPRSAVY